MIKLNLSQRVPKNGQQNLQLLNFKKKNNQVTLRNEWIANRVDSNTMAHVIWIYTVSNSTIFIYGLFDVKCVFMNISDLSHENFNYNQNFDLALRL